MKHLFNHQLFMILLIFCFSCSQKAENKGDKFIGTWTNGDMRQGDRDIITISSTGGTNYLVVRDRSLASSFMGGGFRDAQGSFKETAVLVGDNLEIKTPLGTQMISFVGSRLLFNSLEYDKQGTITSTTETKRDDSPDLMKIEDFYTAFKKAMGDGQGEEVAKLTHFPYYDGVMYTYKSKEEFLQYFGDFSSDEDYHLMLKYGVPNKEININEKDNGLVSFMECTDASYLETLRKRFELSATAKVYNLRFSYNRHLEGSSHPEQSVSVSLDFGQTESGYRLCGK